MRNVYTLIYLLPDLHFLECLVLFSFTIKSEMSDTPSSLPAMIATATKGPAPRQPPTDPNRLPDFEVILRQNDPDDPKNRPTWYRMWAIATVSFSA